MRLSSRAEYGTCALIELGLSYPYARPWIPQRIAETQHLSKKYLIQRHQALAKPSPTHPVATWSSRLSTLASDPQGVFHASLF